MTALILIGYVFHTNWETVITVLFLSLLAIFCITGIAVRKK